MDAANQYAEIISGVGGDAADKLVGLINNMGLFAIFGQEGATISDAQYESLLTPDVVEQLLASDNETLQIAGSALSDIINDANFSWSKLDNTTRGRFDEIGAYIL